VSRTSNACLCLCAQSWRIRKTGPFWFSKEVIFKGSVREKKSMKAGVWLKW
jgi:hypothetical protein